MSLIPSSHSRLAWFQTGLFNGAGRGGPVRLVAIGGVLELVALAVRRYRPSPHRSLIRSAIVS
jgi:hypothetical protein